MAGRAPRAPLVGTALRWAAILGAAGFAAGFLGPMVLDPESNIGPVIGVLFSGPGGALAGLLLGALFAGLPVPAATRPRALFAACALLVLGTLYACLPAPAVRGYVIEARVRACEKPPQRTDASLAAWEEALTRVTWARPPANWREAATRNVEAAPGVVLTMHIERKRAILRHRRPWDRGATSAGSWIEADESHAYYDAAEGSDCAAYLSRPRALYWPIVDPRDDPTQPSPEWPPTDALGFLQLQPLGPVPEEYRRLIER